MACCNTRPRPSLWPPPPTQFRCRSNSGDLVPEFAPLFRSSRRAAHLTWDWRENAARDAKLAPSAFLGADKNWPGAEAHYAMRLTFLRSTNGEEWKNFLAGERRGFNPEWSSGRAVNDPSCCLDALFGSRIDSRGFGLSHRFVFPGCACAGISHVVVGRVVRQPKRLRQLAAEQPHGKYKERGQIDGLQDVHSWRSRTRPKTLNNSGTLL